MQKLKGTQRNQNKWRIGEIEDQGFSEIDRQRD